MASDKCMYIPFRLLLFQTGDDSEQSGNIFTAILSFELTLYNIQHKTPFRHRTSHHLRVVRVVVRKFNVFTRAFTNTISHKFKHTHTQKKLCYAIHSHYPHKNVQHNSLKCIRSACGMRMCCKSLSHVQQWQQQ